MRVAAPLLTAAAVVSAAAAGDLRFAHSYGSSMVLQRAPRRAVVWGYAAAGAGVEVSISPPPSGGAAKVTAAVSGTVWRAVLPAVPGGAASYNVTAVDTASGDTAALTDVLFGDVWVCSGQSNMAFLLEMDLNGRALLRDADNWPDIRMFTSKKLKSSTPLAEQPEIEQPWSVGSSCAASMNCKPKRGRRLDLARAESGAGDDNWLYMSAVCWLYGREVRRHTGLPVGLVNTNWGGQPVEFFSSADARAACADPGAAGAAWNGMVRPLLNMTVAGAVWYQGESNTKDKYTATGGPGGAQELPSYACRFPAMIADWRAKWGEGTGGQTDPQFPFGFVQLAAWQADISAAAIRWAQTAGYGYVPNPQMPNTFMAVAIDMGDHKSPYGNVHVRHKQDIGYRLGLGGAAVAYGAKVAWRGPVPSAATQAGGVATVTFDQPITVVAGDPAAQWELCRSAACPLNATEGWEAARAARAAPDAVTVAAETDGLVAAGEGYCQNYKELAHAASPAACLQLGEADAGCDHAHESVSVGKGSRSGRCICGKDPCGSIAGISLGANGWDRYNVSDTPPPAPAAVTAVRYAWSAFPCEYLNCSIYGGGAPAAGGGGGLPAAPFMISVA